MTRWRLRTTTGVWAAKAAVTARYSYTRALGVVVIAVLLIVFLAPGGVAAPAEATDSASAAQTVASGTDSTPTPVLTAHA